MCEITLDELLESRDRRAEFQRELIDGYMLPLVSLTVNMPGPVKRDVRSKFVFEEGVAAVRECLAGRIMYSKLKDRPTGFEGFFSVEMDARELKRLMVRIEDSHGMGRLLDIDVLDTGGNIIGRGDLGLPTRRCLVCGEDGAACGRSRNHSFEQLFEKIDDIIDDFKRM